MAGSAAAESSSLKRKNPSEVRVAGALDNVETIEESNVMTNNSTALKNVTPENMPAITHAGRPVVTTALLAKLYGTEAAYITKNFHRNQDRFVAGKHYHKLEGAELKEFKHCMSLRHSVEIPRQARNLVLWTERGAARHAKMLDTDQAWDVFEKLEDCYFEKFEATAQLAIEDQRITPSQQRHVQQRVAELAGGDRGKFAKIYRSIKDRFMVGTYKDIPESSYNDLCSMLMCAPLDGEWLEKEAVEANPISLTAYEAQHVYLLMSRIAVMGKYQSRVGEASRALDSAPLKSVYSQLLESQSSFGFLDKRIGSRLYEIYRSLGVDGGYRLGQMLTA